MFSLPYNTLIDIELLYIYYKEKSVARDKYFDQIKDIINSASQNLLEYSTQRFANTKHSVKKTSEIN